MLFTFRWYCHWFGMESGKEAYLVRTEDFGTGRRGQRDVNNNLFIRFFTVDVHM